jgi:hypothetical protein
MPDISRSSENPKRRSLFIWLALLVIVFAGWYFFVRSTPEKTVREFIAVNKNLTDSTSDGITAMNALISAKSENVGYDPWAILPHAENINETEYIVGQAAIDGNKAVVKIGVPASKEQVPIGLIKEGRAWKIDLEETEKLNSKGGKI